MVRRQGKPLLKPIEAIRRDREKLRQEFGTIIISTCFGPRMDHYVLEKFGKKIARGLLRYQKRHLEEAKRNNPGIPMKVILDTMKASRETVLNQFETHLKDIEAARKKHNRKLPNTMQLLRRGTLPFELARNMARFVNEELDNNPHGPKTNALEVLHAVKPQDMDHATKALEVGGKSALSALHYMPTQIGATVQQIHELFMTADYAGLPAEHVRTRAHLQGIEQAIRTNWEVAKEKDRQNAELISRMRKMAEEGGPHQPLRIVPGRARRQFDASETQSKT